MERELEDYKVVPPNRVVEFAEKGYELFGFPFYDAAQHVAVQALIRYKEEHDAGER